MFDIGAEELLAIVIVAIIVIGPKDMPMAMRTAGRWIGKVRRMSSHFRSGLDAMVREAELEEMEKKWQAQNKKIMEENPDSAEMTALDGEKTAPTGTDSDAKAALPAPDAASAEARVEATAKTPEKPDTSGTTKDPS